ncbi:MAG: NAD+ synthase [Candidatus Eisenbacteria bacterium]|nr:NAD+ synthase [Candidatus Eisenbacteria bacterium]
MRIALAQLNATVGDFDGNLERAVRALDDVRDASPDLVVFPELFLTGYPPRDLLERSAFLDRTEEALDGFRELSRRLPGTALLVGTVLRNEAPVGKGLLNAAVLVKDGSVVGSAAKTLLPMYDVFDEARYFDRADTIAPLRLDGTAVGVTICEDAWTAPDLWPRRIYEREPVAELADAGAELLVNIAASPFYVGKDVVRHRLFADHARERGVPFVVVNLVGGNDELIFDGRSMCFAADGRLLASLPAFEEAVAVVDTTSSGTVDFVPENRPEAVRRALVMGVRDYVRKCGFERVLIGLSGGIDSAVVAAIAVEALEPGNVLGVTMPSPYSSEGSVTDSRELARNLGIECREVAISEIYDAYRSTLSSNLPEDRVSVAEENIQARIRGNILMALSNRSGGLVLSTGNKSELAVGYCTLYGDMTGGLAVLSDVPKTMVYELATHMNAEHTVIPEAILTKPPSAELKPGQVDSDTLPPYDVLDRILDRYVDRGATFEQIVSEGLDEDDVRWVIRNVNANEYKRRQAAPGLKVTTKAFGMGRRMPIAARYDTWNT